MPEAVVAITGASGARYGVRLVDQLVEAGWSVNLIVTSAGAINLDLECGIPPEELAIHDSVTLEDNDNLAARAASGKAGIPTNVPLTTVPPCPRSPPAPRPGAWP